MRIIVSELQIFKKTKDMNLSKNIKAVARKHGKTIKNIAQDMGVLPPHISRAINNPHVQLSMLEQIANVIGCEVVEFFVGEQEENTKSDFEFRCPHCGKTICVTKK